MLDSGSGTEQNPYVITTGEELQAVKEDLSAHYKLANDIDVSNSKPEEFEPIGDERNPFTGMFDGNNCEICNLCIKRPEKDYYIGIFGCIGQKGRVVNLGLANATIEGNIMVGGLVGRNYGIVESSYLVESDVSGQECVGGLVGLLERRREVETSYVVKSNISGDGNVGGLVGLLECRGEVETSYVVKSNVSGDDENVGGLIGWNNGELASSCTAKVDVSGDKRVGGLVGTNHKTVNLSYTAKVDVSGDEDVGNLVGWNYSTGQLESSFVLSSTDKTNILENADLVLPKGNHRIFYIVETKTLYLQIDDEIYSGKKVSPIKLQSLLESTEVIKVTEKFKTSVVATT